MRVVMLSSTLLASLLATSAIPAPLGSAAPLQEAQEADPLYARPEVFEDEEAVERGRRVLERVVARAGGREAFEALPGLRYEMLQTMFVPALLHEPKKAAEEERWDVHHRVPKLCFFDLEGNGYVKSEYVKGAGFGPSYRREVYYDRVGWAEMGGSFVRQAAHKRVENSLRREQFLATMPFSIEAYGGEVVWIETIEHGGRDCDALLLWLAEPLVMDTHELVSEMVLLAAPEEDRIVQIRWAIVGDDRALLPGKSDVVMGYADFEGSVEVEGVTLPGTRYLWNESRQQLYSLEMADPVADELPPEALRRPWQSGVLYETPLRADAWDPPGWDPEKGRTTGTED